MPPRPVTLVRLRQLRGPRARDLSMGSDLDRMTADLESRRRAGRHADDAWESTAPEGLRQVATVTGIRGGVLTLRTPDSGTRFLVDRWLRCGGEAAIIRAARVGVRRVVVR